MFLGSGEHKRVVPIFWLDLRTFLMCLTVETLSLKSNDLKLHLVVPRETTSGTW